MEIIKHRQVFFVISGLLVVVSLVSFWLWGLNLGIDFTGGSLLEINWSGQSPAVQDVQMMLNSLSETDQSLNLGTPNIQATGSQGMLIRLKDLDETAHQKVLQTLKDKFGELEEKRFESVGPVIGSELKTKALESLSVALIAILLFVAWAFRRVSFPVKSYRYGLIAIIALFHDVLIVVGVFAWLGHFYGVEIDVSFVAALLTVLGYSVNDTIVVFDRVRENLLSHKSAHDDFAQTVNQSLRETIVRSINTSLTTLLVLLAIFLFGGTTIKFFALALIIGIASGTYSSLFIASPLLVSWEKRRRS